VNREAYLDTKNTKFEARNSKQYKNLNDPNSKLCFAWLYCQIMLFGVYLLIRKRAVLRYIYRLLAVYVSLLANIGVLYQILSLISSRFEKNVRDTALYSGRSLVRSELK